MILFKRRYTRAWIFHIYDYIAGKKITYAECKFFNKKSVQIVEADSHISD